MIKNILLFFLCFSFGMSMQAQKYFFKNSSSEIPDIYGFVEGAQDDTEVGQYPQAFEKLTFALTVSEKANDSVMIAAINHEKAKVFLALRDYKNALNSIDASISTKKNLPKPTPLIASYLVKAVIFLEQSKFVAAEKAYQKTEALDFSSPETTTLKNLYLGRKWNMTGEPRRALKPLKAALKFFEGNDHYFKESLCLFYLAKANRDLGHMEKALKLANAAKNLSSQHNYSLNKVKALELIGELYFTEEKYAEANTYRHQAIQLRDSLFQNVNKSSVGFLKNLEDHNVAAETISRLARENYENEKTLKFNKTAIIFSVLLIVILALLIVSLFKNNTLRGSANKILYKKNAELLKAKDKAEAASRAKEQFLSTVTHEMRTPIYTITGLTYLLLKEDLSKTQKENLNSLRVSGEHLLELINNVLDFNKLNANKVKIVPVDFSLRKQMNEFLSTFKNTAEEKEVNLILELDDTIPDRLNGDIAKIRHVLMNLMSNAIKFSGKGSVWLRLKLVEEEKATVKVTFEVEDKGIGIPKNKRQKIFQKFDQGARETNITYGGTGLGLPIVKDLLPHFGSKINLESKEGQGSKFYFTLNFKKTGSFKKSAPKLSDKPMRTSDKDKDKLFAGKTVLVAEDNKLNQKVTQRILEKHGISSEIAENGKVALEMFQAKKFDLVLMDIHMPVMGGIEATKVIREKDAEVPVIALTAVDIKDNSEEIEAADFTAIIQKPFKTDQFFEKLYGIFKQTDNQ